MLGAITPRGRIAFIAGVAAAGVEAAVGTLT